MFRIDLTQCHRKTWKDVVNQLNLKKTICVFLYSTGETCPFGGQKNELLHFEEIATKEQALLQQENKRLEGVVHHTQDQLKILRSSRAQMEAQREIITKLTDENNALKGNATKEQATLQQENERLERSDLSHPEEHKIKAQIQHMHEMNTKLTNENNALKGTQEQIRYLEYELKMQMAHKGEIAAEKDDCLTLWRKMQDLNEKSQGSQGRQNMRQNRELRKTVERLQSEIRGYKTQLDAELSLCLTELETRDTHQTDFLTRNHAIIDDYKGMTDKLEKKLLETRGFAREQQDTMEQLHRNREEMNTRIEKYVKLHVKHKKLQSTINDIYSKTTKYFARRGPSRQLPTPSRPTRQKRQPFARNQFGGGANNSEVSQSSDKLQRATAANTTR